MGEGLLRKAAPPMRGRLAGPDLRSQKKARDLTISG